jgi:hypothetical protein
VRYDETYWAMLGMLAQAHQTTRPNAARMAVMHFAHSHGLDIADGEVVTATPAWVPVSEWLAIHRSTAEEEIHGGGRSTGQGPAESTAGDPATSTSEETA